MARLTKEEKKVFDPSLLIQNQKWKSDTIKDLTISGGGNVPGEDGPYRKPPPSETPPYPPEPKPELANFLTPSGSGRTISDEAYWDGLNTILSTTEAGSDEQNKRLNILMHQFQDQVKKPQKDLKIAETDPLSDYDVTDKGLYMNYMGDMFMNLDGMLFPMGQGYDEGTHGKLVPKGLVQSMQINQDVANITPKDFSPPPFRYMPHIRIPAIKDAEMKHMKNFIEAMGGSTKGLTKRNQSMKVYGS